MASVDGKLFQTGYTELEDVDIEKYLQRKLNAEEKALIVDLIRSTEHEFASRCNRNFDFSQTYYEFLNGGECKYELINTPISSVTDLIVNGVSRKTTLVENTNYWIYDNEVIFLVPVVGSGYQLKAVKIEYKIRQFWGDDVIEGIKKMVAHRFLTSADGGVAHSSTSFSNTSENHDLSGFRKEYENLIFRYTNFSI